MLHPSPAQPATDIKPNLLFLIADDQAYETIGALGLTDIETLNLDRLVKSGTTFTHAYNMGGWHGAPGGSRPTFSVSAHRLSANWR